MKSWTMIVFLRSALINVLFFAMTIAVMIGCLPLFLGPRRWVRKATNLWARGVLHLLSAIIGLRYRIVGIENWPRGTGLIAANHQSAWETIAFLALFPPTSYVLKKELLRLPLLGWYLRRLRMIAINRAGGGRALQRLLLEAKAEGEPRQIVIFPEGTRVPPGERRAFHSGVAALYSRLDLPITPVALNSGLFWRRRAFIKRPGIIDVEVMPAIPPGLARRRFMTELQDKIDAARQRLEKSAMET